MLLTFALAFFAGLGYTTWRLISLAPMPSGLRWLVAALWIGSALSCALAIFYSRQLSIPLARLVYSFSTSWIIWFLYVVLVLVLVDLLRFIPQLRGLLAPSWYLAASVLTLLIGIFVWASYRYEHKVRVPLDIATTKQLDKPLKIVGISDLHLGYTIGRGELERWVKLINAERPDLILIAGDLVDGDVRPVLADQMAQVLNQLEAPVYACLGNHEYIGGEALEKRVLSQTKITLLQDSVALFEDKLYIIGRDDATNRGRQSLSALTAGLDRSKPILLLDHQPYNLEQAETAGVDFQLSGHTHRGQVFPLNLIVDQMYERSHGYHRRGDTQYYVSSGIGIWGGKYRIGTQSEYAVITLHSQH